MQSTYYEPFINVGIITVRHRQFYFSLREPVFWRLTSGDLPFLHPPGIGITARGYMQIKAMLAYLLLIPAKPK